MHPNRLASKPTTSLKRHYLSCKIYHRTQRESQSSSILERYWDKNEPTHNRYGTKPVTNSMLEEEILKFVISGNIPFNQVENQHFRNLISWIRVNERPAQPPSRKVIRARLSSKSESAQENLRTILAANSSKIGLALDCWSTRTNYGFLGTWLLCDINTNISSNYRTLDR